MKKGAHFSANGVAKAREAGDLLEKCLLTPHCRERHRATACEKFKSLSLQHRQSIIAEQESLIRSLPLERLEALAEALLDFEGMADLHAWLAANA